MSDRLIGQPMPDNTGDSSRRGEAAAAADGAAGDDVPDPGDSASGSGEQAPGDGADDADRAGPGAPAGPGGAAPCGGSRAASARAARRHRSFWRELPILVIVALVIALLIKTYVVQAFFIPSGSMENTLEIGDKILVNKLVYHFRSIQPGDIVVFNGAGSWTPHRHPRGPVPIRLSGPTT